MILDLQTLKEYGIPADHLSYRGVDIDFYEDASCHQLVAIWKDQLVEFGSYNTQAREDMKLLIDEDLDTITRFSYDPKFYGAKLEYFQNGAFSDIRLVYRGRVLYIFLNPNQADLDMIKKSAETILKRVLNYTINSDLSDSTVL